ncbi:MAG: chorismate synthase [Bacilli bacterium]|nr:chorismate synthase [Bacilli bacterium]
MISTFGNNIKVSLFGESHGEYIGVTVSGLPSGLEVRMEEINAELVRRRPQGDLETKRIENDELKIISGIYNGYTTGAPLTILIKNNDVKSEKYLDGIMRPGTSDYPSYIRSTGYADLRGGGHFSGRLTAPLVALYPFLRKILNKKGIYITTKVKESYNQGDDTAGFVSTVTIKGMPVGVGEPFFDSVESVLSHLLFAIPSVKGVSFGDFDIAMKKGNDVKDELSINDGEVKILSNHNGGINGGLTNGNDIIINVSFKPISSLSASQNTINIKTKENVSYKNENRNDKSIVGRAQVIMEAVCAIGLYDLLVTYYGSNDLK